MDVKEAVVRAKTYVADLFADEGVRELGLEEVEFDDVGHAWNITVGFTRVWAKPENPFAMAFSPRSYKVVSLRDDDGRVVSVRHREVSK